MNFDILIQYDLMTVLYWFIQILSILFCSSDNYRIHLITSFNDLKNLKSIQLQQWVN